MEHEYIRGEQDVYSMQQELLLCVDKQDNVFDFSVPLYSAVSSSDPVSNENTPPAFSENKEKIFSIAEKRFPRKTFDLESDNLMRTKISERNGTELLRTCKKMGVDVHTAQIAKETFDTVNKEARVSYKNTYAFIVACILHAAKHHEIVKVMRTIHDQFDRSLSEKEFSLAYKKVDCIVKYSEPQQVPDGDKHTDTQLVLLDMYMHRLRFSDTQIAYAKTFLDKMVKKRMIRIPGDLLIGVVLYTTLARENDRKALETCVDVTGLNGYVIVQMYNKVLKELNGMPIIDLSCRL